MGGKKKYSKPTQLATNKDTINKKSEEDKRFVNLLHVYTIYKQKFRRLSKQQLEEVLQHGCMGKRAATELCKEFMKAKDIPDEISFEKNTGFLSLPRFMPLIALLAERGGYKIKPSLVHEIDFSKTPKRFEEKFSQLMVYGFWFLGRVISDSLSVKEQVNRGNIFNFTKGDMGFWWAGVRILDWNYYVHVEKNPENCYSFAIKDPPKYRFYTTRAIINMHQHPLYFLSDFDWQNYVSTLRSIKHALVSELSSSCESDVDAPSEDISSNLMWSSESDVSSFMSSQASLNTLASRESID